MSEAVQAAVVSAMITGAFQIVLRYMSHKEHDKTKLDVEAIRVIVENGNHKE